CARWRDAMNKPALLLSALIAFPLATPSAFAQSAAAPQAEAVMGKPDCAAPDLVNSVPMERVNGGNVMSVTASIDGAPQRMLIDIGRMATQLFETSANKLHLGHQGSQHFDFAGRFSQRSARIESFELGSMEGGGFHLLVTPDPDTASAPFDGIIGNDVMIRYDVDLDFAHQKLNFFTPEKCKGAGIYWSPSTITSVPVVAYSGLEYADRSPIPRLGVTYVPVVLDGKTIIALLDTRADKTFLNPDVAQKLFGISPGGMEPTDVDDGGTLIKAGTHVFKSLSFGGLTAGNVHVAIPLDVMSQSTKIFHISKVLQDTFPIHEIMPDMVIGMDLLKHSHLYVSFQNDRVYVSAAGDGPALAAAAPAKTTWLNVYR
ncbi:MAG TPA: retropepsin-like aspartic protease, partial [Rhizomicrobium sp.]